MPTLNLTVKHSDPEVLEAIARRIREEVMPEFSQAAFEHSIILKHSEPLSRIDVRIHSPRTCQVAEWRTTPPDMARLNAEQKNLPIDKLSLCVRTSNRLKQDGYMTLGDLSVITVSDIHSIYGLGDTALIEIAMALKSQGIELQFGTGAYHGNQFWHCIRH